MKWIAENYLYMNIDYVSKRFVKETGERFSDYLTRLRIQKAKELLSGDGTENDKILSVAEMVGCGNNPKYFSQLFRKAVGMTPSAYIKFISGGNKYDTGNLKAKTDAVANKLLHLGGADYDKDKNISLEEAIATGNVARDFGIEEWDWPQGVGLYGLYMLQEHEGDDRYLDFFENWFQSNIKKDCLLGILILQSHI